ncbi:hypothetical protein DFH06DRAFT_1293857 [Mycena polygramma]|nr:hypothetical protein DFH06DRAFT_1293857 [Mycena polygramma]
MNDETELEPGPATQTVHYQSGSPLDGYTGGFFPKAKDFNVSGGSFTSVSHIYQAAPSVPMDFRVIPLGDLDLLHKIDRPGSKVVRRSRLGRASTRRVYAARIPGLQSKVTAAVYEGHGSEKEWRKEIMRHANLRHPNLVQLYGVVKTQSLHAAVFHHDLIPYDELKAKFYNSHLLAGYFWAFLHMAFVDVNEYMLAVLCKSLNWYECTVWIRPSTGRPTIALTPPESDDFWRFISDTGFQPANTSLLEPPADTDIFGSMSLEDYHSNCCLYLGRWKYFQFPRNVSMNRGSVRHICSARYEDSLEIAFNPEDWDYNGGWYPYPKASIIQDVWNPFVFLPHM